MAPRSPTQAFDPTPALEQNRQNYSPFNEPPDMLSLDRYSSGVSKEVRFSDPPIAPYHRAHSIATDKVPLLPAIPSASSIPRTAFRITNPTPGIDITAYIENCRNLNEQLRQAHEAERRAWNIERTALKSRIADLEFQVNKSNDTKRRASNDVQSHSKQHNFKHDFRAMYQSKKLASQKAASDSVVPMVAPVWKGPESTAPTTRVFQNNETNGHHLSSISEDTEALPSLTKEISPSTVIESEPIPVEKVDSTLDGITLRSAGLASSFEAKIVSPQFGSPQLSPGTERNGSASENNSLHIDASTLLSPLDEKLKRHAGHTPMAIYGDEGSTAVSDQTTELPTPVAENPPAPAPTTRPPLRPSENSDSYFSTVNSELNVPKVVKEEANGESMAEEGNELEPQFEPEDDKPLKGPLMLDSSARTKAASSFLEKLDAKLEAVRESSPDRRQSFVSTTSTNDSVPEPPKPQQQQPAAEIERKQEQDDEPKLKLKKSTNFGSAYGFSMPGRM